jgi:hypothetical protein
VTVRVIPDPSPGTAGKDIRGYNLEAERSFIVIRTTGWPWRRRTEWIRVQWDGYQYGTPGIESTKPDFHSWPEHARIGGWLRLRIIRALGPMMHYRKPIWHRLPAPEPERAMLPEGVYR